MSRTRKFWPMFFLKTHQRNNYHVTLTAMCIYGWKSAHPGDMWQTRTLVQLFSKTLWARGEEAPRTMAMGSWQVSMQIHSLSVFTLCTSRIFLKILILNTLSQGAWWHFPQRCTKTPKQNPGDTSLFSLQCPALTQLMLYLHRKIVG